MDLSDFDTRRAEEGTFCHLRHPVTNKPLHDPENGEAVGVVLRGEDSSAWREAENAIMASYAEAAANKETITADRMRGDVLTKVVACTVAFRNVAMDGKAIDVKREASVRAAYARLPWMLDQAIEHIRRRANFLPAPPTESAKPSQATTAPTSPNGPAPSSNGSANS